MSISSREHGEAEGGPDETTERRRAPILARLLPIGRRNRSMQFWLGWLVVCCILPAALVAGVLIHQSYQRERASMQRDMVATARALMQAVDADLQGILQILEALAVSKSLSSGDLESFYGEAKALLPTQVGSNIVVHDPTGQQVINTLKPFGAPLPRESDLRMVERVLATQKPVVSDLFRGPLTGQMVLGMSAPVFIDGKVAYLVGMGLFSHHLGEVLQRQKIPPGWIVSILDRSGTMGARTEEEDAYVGKKASPELLQRSSVADEDAYETVNEAGVASFEAFSRSPRTGWMIAFSVPASVVTAGLQQALFINVGLALVVLLLGVLLAKSIAARMTRSLDALVPAALALGSDEKIAVPPVEIEEVNALGRALAKAAELIEARARERDQAEQNERRMLLEKQAADDANRAKSEFLALMSHELRTPLNAVLGYAQILERERFGAVNVRQKEFVTQILSSGTHLLELINDILDLSVIEVGQIAVSMERVELVPLMKSVVATLEQSARKSGIVVVAQDYGAGMPPVMTDRLRLAQVLLNLGSNAIKYNRPGGTLRLGCEQTGDMVRLSVEDNGVGIPADRHEELFRPFNRLGAENRAIEGTGVGLALSGRLVELMGGTIGFSSREGEGSCFWVDIPLYRPQAGDAEAEASIAASDEPAPRGFSVLYVEDNPANLALVRHIFATLEDVTMFEAEHGRTGFEMAVRHRPDVILLDLHLPDMSGYAVLEQIKRTRELAATPVLALSAGVLAHDIQRGLDAGFFRYITKPLKLRDFLGAIQAALDSRGQEIAASE